MSDTHQISKESNNRIFIRHHALVRAYEALVAEGYFRNNLRENAISEQHSLKYNISGVEGVCEVRLSAANALIAEAILLYGQVFNKGREGDGISKNLGNDEVDTFREDMKRSVIKELQWDQIKYENFHEFIMTIRDKTIGHYDGDDAGYREPIPGVVRIMKSPRATFPRDMISDFLSLLSSMDKFILKNL